MSTYPKSPKEMTSGIMYFPRLLNKIGALYSLGMRHCEMPLTTDAQSAKQDINHADLGMAREIEIQ